MISSPNEPLRSHWHVCELKALMHPHWELFKAFDTLLTTSLKSYFSYALFPFLRVLYPNEKLNTQIDFWRVEGKEKYPKAVYNSTSLSFWFLYLCSSRHSKRLDFFFFNCFYLETSVKKSVFYSMLDKYTNT